MSQPINNVLDIIAKKMLKITVTTGKKGYNFWKLRRHETIEKKILQRTRNVLEISSKIYVIKVLENIMQRIRNVLKVPQEVATKYPGHHEITVKRFGIYC